MKSWMYRITMTLAFAVVMISIVQAQIPAGIAFEYDITTAVSAEAGQAIALALRACDERNGTVEDWDSVGKDATLIVRGSMAETDTSTRSWNRRSRAFTWMHIKAGSSVLPLDSIRFAGSEPLLFYTIPRDIFVLGHATLSFTQSRADSGIILSLAPRWSSLTQDSPPLRFLPGPPENFLVEITSQTENPNQVYLLRRYEAVVTPRDMYLNVSPDSSLFCLFTARFPGEFDQNQPGLSDVLGIPFAVRGPTPLMLASRIARRGPDPVNPQEMQWIQIRSADDSTIEGRSDEYAILDHAPYPFSLLSPADSTKLELLRSTDKAVFSWEEAQPRDPYNKIRISRFDTAHTYSDEVWYMIRVVDGISLARAVDHSSDNDGRDTRWTATHKTLRNIVDAISGLPTTRTLDAVWYVEATDGLYTTVSRQPSEQLPGLRITIDKRLYYEVPDAVEALPQSPGIILHPNYPNPFNPTTEIPFTLQASGYCRLCVLDLMGKEVAVLHDGFLEAGAHRFTFDGRDLPSGVYSYRLEADGVTRTRTMVLLR